MYDDDLVIFFKYFMKAANNLICILDTFFGAAGLAINKQKSNLVLSPNAPRIFKKFISKAFGMFVLDKLGKYLGVFVDDHQEHKRIFVDLINKIQHCLVGWKNKLLS